MTAPVLPPRPRVHQPAVEQCCDLHTNTCGHEDYCCNDCPALGDGTDGQLLAAALVGVLLLVLAWLALA